MHGFGTFLYVDELCDQTLVQVGCLIDIDIATGLTTTEVADQCLSQTDPILEMTPGFIDPGTTVFTIKFDKAQLALLYTNIFCGRKIVCWEVLLPDGSKWNFTGFIQSINPTTVPEDDRITASVTIRITDKAVFTPAP